MVGGGACIGYYQLTHTITMERRPHTKVDTAETVADIFTKNLSPATHGYHRAKLVRPMPQRHAMRPPHKGESRPTKVTWDAIALHPPRARP